MSQKQKNSKKAAVSPKSTKKKTSSAKNGKRNSEKTVSKSLRRPRIVKEKACDTAPEETLPVVSEDKVRESRSHSKRKDPTDALGNFISVLDTEKIAKDVDFIDIDAEIRRMLEKVDNDCKKLISEINFIRLCSAFDLKIRELMAMMMERYPEKFGLQFMKSTVRPFVVGLIREKNEYASGTAGYFNKPIFRYL